MQSYVQDRDVKNDPVFATWKFLKHQVQGGEGDCSDPIIKEHPLVNAGLIPKRLADIFRKPPDNEKLPRLGRRKALVLTSEEIRKEFEDKENKKRKKESKTEKAKQVCAIKSETNRKKKKGRKPAEQCMTKKKGTWCIKKAEESQEAKCTFKSSGLHHRTF